jgi:hypothetical protein
MWLDGRKATMETDAGDTPGLSRWLLIASRITGAALTGWSAAIHLHLWSAGYRDIQTIGVLFLINAIGGIVLAVALLVVPSRFLTIVTMLAALYAASVLGALIISLTMGLFGFFESSTAELVTTTLVINSVGFVVLALLTAVRLTSAKHERVQ